MYNHEYKNVTPEDINRLICFAKFEKKPYFALDIGDNDLNPMRRSLIANGMQNLKLFKREQHFKLYSLPLPGEKVVTIFEIFARVAKGKNLLSRFQLLAAD